MFPSLPSGLTLLHNSQESTLHQLSHLACASPAATAQGPQPTAAHTDAPAQRRVGVAIAQYSLHGGEGHRTVEVLHKRMPSKDAARKGSEDDCLLASTQSMSKKRASSRVDGPECCHTQTGGGAKRTRCSPLSTPGLARDCVVPPQHVAPVPSGCLRIAVHISPAYRGEGYPDAADTAAASGEGGEMEDYHSASEPDLEDDDPSFTMETAHQPAISCRKSHASGKDARSKRRQAADFVSPTAPNDANAAGVPGYGTRVKVATILLPKVRRLSDAELSARNSAVAALREETRCRAEQGLGPAPVEDGATSEEETSDESFAARHAPLIAEERCRFQLAAMGGSMAVAQRKLAPTKKVGPRKLDEPTKKVHNMKKPPCIEKPQSTRKRVRLATLKNLPKVTGRTGQWDVPSFDEADLQLPAVDVKVESHAAAAGTEASVSQCGPTSRVGEGHVTKAARTDHDRGKGSQLNSKIPSDMNGAEGGPVGEHTTKKRNIKLKIKLGGRTWYPTSHVTSSVPACDALIVRDPHEIPSGTAINVQSPLQLAPSAALDPNLAAEPPCCSAEPVITDSMACCQQQQQLPPLWDGHDGGLPVDDFSCSDWRPNVISIAPQAGVSKSAVVISSRQECPVHNGYEKLAGGLGGKAEGWDEFSGTASSCDDSFLYEIDEIALPDFPDVPHLNDVGGPGAWDWWSPV